MWHKKKPNTHRTYTRHAKQPTREAMQSNQKLLSTSININIVHVNSILMWISQTILYSCRIVSYFSCTVLRVFFFLSILFHRTQGPLHGFFFLSFIILLEKMLVKRWRTLLILHVYVYKFKKHLAIHVEQTDKQYG